MPPIDVKWLPVIGYEGFYEVSDQGGVRSIDRIIQDSLGRQRQLFGKILAVTISSKGYGQVNLSKEGRIEVLRVHRLVALAFFGYPPLGAEVCHNDGNFLDNSAGNLRWGTHSDNMVDIVRHGRNSCRNRTVCPRGHSLEVPNLTLDSVRLGHRRCLACSRARTYLYNNSELMLNLKTESDRYYFHILNEESGVRRSDW